MWELILNEIWYLVDFVWNVYDIVEVEYLYFYCYSGCDSEVKGKEYFQIFFIYLFNGDGGVYLINDIKKQLIYFICEWGDNVDDWNLYNFFSCVVCNWGEQVMFI